ncbi:hypothetical protein NSQ54_08170 [Alkalihalobacillus sp. FSL W8-0930]
MKRYYALIICAFIGSFLTFISQNDFSALVITNGLLDAILGCLIYFLDLKEKT